MSFAATIKQERQRPDAAMMPALVDGQPPTATIENIPASGAGKFSQPPTARFENIPAGGAGKILESTHP